MQPRPNAAARGGGAKNDPPDKSKPKSRKSQPSPERTNPVRAQWQGDNKTKTTQTGKSKAAAKRQLQQDNSPSGKSPDHKKGTKIAVHEKQSLITMKLKIIYAQPLNINLQISVLMAAVQILHQWGSSKNL